MKKFRYRFSKTEKVKEYRQEQVPLQGQHLKDCVQNWGKDEMPKCRHWKWG
jgi:hypothetical protein